MRVAIHAAATILLENFKANGPIVKTLINTTPPDFLEYVPTSDEYIVLSGRTVDGHVWLHTMITSYL